jgi:hypothetical protein
MLGYGAVDGSPMSSEGSGRGRSASRSQTVSRSSGDAERKSPDLPGHAAASGWQVRVDTYFRLQLAGLVL